MEWLKELLGTILGSEVAWGAIVVFSLAKFLPNELIAKGGKALGTIVTLGMTKWLPFWKKIEDWLIDGLAVFTTAFIDGLRSDD